MNNKILKYTISSTIILIIALLVSCAFSNGIKVTIKNISSNTIRGVVVHVTGNSYSIGDIPAGTLKTIKVVSKGESHIELEQKGVQKRLIVDCYFEKGYRGEILIEITPDQVVDVKNNISIY